MNINAEAISTIGGREITVEYGEAFFVRGRRVAVSELILGTCLGVRRIIDGM